MSRDKSVEVLVGEDAVRRLPKGLGRRSAVGLEVSCESHMRWQSRCERSACCRHRRREPGRLKMGVTGVDADRKEEEKQSRCRVVATVSCPTSASYPHGSRVQRVDRRPSGGALRVWPKLWTDSCIIDYSHLCTRRPCLLRLLLNGPGSGIASRRVQISIGLLRPRHVRARRVRMRVRVDRKLLSLRLVPRRHAGAPTRPGWCAQRPLQWERFVLDRAVRLCRGLLGLRLRPSERSGLGRAVQSHVLLGSRRLATPPRPMPLRGGLCRGALRERLVPTPLFWSRAVYSWCV